VRVAAGVHLAQPGNRDRRVNLRRIQPGVPKQFLDHAQVSPVFQKVRLAGVPEQVATARFVSGKDKPKDVIP